jgi:hypothetical protein
MQPKLTDWFPPDVKPVRVGVYEMRPGNDIVWGGQLGRFQHWNGERWGGYSSSPNLAALSDCVNFTSMHQHRGWRGLAEKPE